MSPSALSARAIHLARPRMVRESVGVLFGHFVAALTKPLTRIGVSDSPFRGGVLHVRRLVTLEEMCRVYTGRIVAAMTDSQRWLVVGDPEGVPMRLMSPTAFIELPIPV